MTGFGKSTCEINGKKINIEVKSLNSKQLDISSRVPSNYRDKEMAIRNILSDKIIRGKVDFSMYTESSSDTSTEINTDVVKAYYKQISQLASDLGLCANSAELLTTAIRMPYAIKTEHYELTDADWATMNNAIANTSSTPWRKSPQAANSAL